MPNEGYAHFGREPTGRVWGFTPQRTTVRCARAPGDSDSVSEHEDRRDRAPYTRRVSQDSYYLGGAQSANRNAFNYGFNYRSWCAVWAAPRPRGPRAGARARGPPTPRYTQYGDSMILTECIFSQPAPRSVSSAYFCKLVHFSAWGVQIFASTRRVCKLLTRAPQAQSKLFYKLKTRKSDRSQAEWLFK